MRTQKTTLQLLLSMGLLLAGIAVAGPQSITGSSETEALREFLGDSLFENCGLEKLDPGELRQLTLHLAPPPFESYQREAALRHLLREDWRTLILYPGYPANPAFSTSNLRHVAFVAGRVLLIEGSSIFHGELPPGAYLAKKGAFSVEILDLNGQSLHYDIKREL